MVKNALTESLTRRSTTFARSSRQHPVTCRSTNQVRHGATPMSQRARRLPLGQISQAGIARTGRPELDVLRTAGAWGYPQTGQLSQLMALLAAEPEPDMLLAQLMRDLAEQLGADALYLLRSDPVNPTFALAPWVIVDGAIQHCGSLLALTPRLHTAIELSAAPQMERYALHQHRPAYLRPTNIMRFRQQGYRVGLSSPCSPVDSYWASWSAWPGMTRLFCQPRLRWHACWQIRSVSRCS